MDQPIRCHLVVLAATIVLQGCKTLLVSPVRVRNIPLGALVGHRPQQRGLRSEQEGLRPWDRAKEDAGFDFSP